MTEELQEALLAEVKSTARTIKLASEKMAAGNKPVGEDLEDLQNRVEKFRLAFKQSGYDHRLAEEMAKGIGLSDMVPSPDRGGPYFETPPGTALLPLWEELTAAKSGGTYTGINDTLFLVATAGMEPARSEVLFKTIINAKPLDKIWHVQHGIKQILSGQDSSASKGVEWNATDSLVKQRTNTVLSSFSPKPVSV